LVDAAFLGGAKPQQITGGGAAEHPLEPMGDAMAVLVGRAMKSIGGGDFRAGLEVEDALPAEVGVKGIGAMDADTGLRYIPVAAGIGLTVVTGGRGEQFKGVMGIVELRRRGGKDEFEAFIGGDDGQQCIHQLAEIADKGDFVQQDGSRPRPRRGDVGRDDFSAGIAGG
jgi:hypothetical protein